MFIYNLLKESPGSDLCALLALLKVKKAREGKKDCCCDNVNENGYKFKETCLFNYLRIQNCLYGRGKNKTLLSLLKDNQLWGKNSKRVLHHPVIDCFPITACLVMLTLYMLGNIIYNICMF